MFNKIYNNIKYISYLKTGKGINSLNVLNYIMLIPKVKNNNHVG